MALGAGMVMASDAEVTAGSAAIADISSAIKGEQSTPLFQRAGRASLEATLSLNNAFLVMGFHSSFR